MEEVIQMCQQVMTITFSPHIIYSQLACSIHTHKHRCSLKQNVHITAYKIIYNQIHFIHWIKSQLLTREEISCHGQNWTFHLWSSYSRLMQLVSHPASHSMWSSSNLFICFIIIKLFLLHIH